uniref:Uncharacterized protein n=1 Tax=Arundo donax TaxID=35708 RepID=A0A0A9HIA4_ARUDO
MNRADIANIAICWSSIAFGCRFKGLRLSFGIELFFPLLSLHQGKLTTEKMAPLFVFCAQNMNFVLSWSWYHFHRISRSLFQLMILFMHLLNMFLSLLICAHPGFSCQIIYEGDFWICSVPTFSSIILPP